MSYLSFNINLASKTISDRFSAVSATAPTLGATITRMVNGVPFSFIVDSYRFDRSTGLYTINGSYDITTRLNQDYSATGLAVTASASDIASDIISSMGKSAALSFSDFKPTGIKYKSGNNYVCNETYASMLQKLFGWTDIVPTILVNVFQRGGVVHALQRGHEDNTIEITPGEIEFGSYAIERRRMQLLFSSSRTYYLTGDAGDVIDSSSDATEPNVYFSGQKTDQSGQQVLAYNYGLLQTDTFTAADGTSTSTASYTYDKIYPPAVLLTKTLTKTETPDNSGIVASNLTSFPHKVISKRVNTSTLTNTMALNGKDLLQAKEEITTTVSSYNITDSQGTTSTNDDEVETHENLTTYSDMGQGQWSEVSYKDGKLVNSQVVTGNPGAKATPYAIKTYSTMRSLKGGKVQPKRVALSGKFAGSMMLNVSDLDTLERVADAIESLNGKTEDRISCTYLGSSLIDFLTTVTFKGNVYYLDGNSISLSPTGGVRQSLSLVRWY